MTFNHREFDCEVVRRLDPEFLDWPERGEAGWRGEDSGFGGNRNYVDLRGAKWSTALQLLEIEEAILARFETAIDPEAAVVDFNETREEALELDDDDPLWGLDLGVAAATLMISAAKCIPFTSCNAGAFGGYHAERHPLVAFMLRRQMVDLTLEVAEEVGAGLYQTSGRAVLYARNIPTMLQFARRLYERRREIDSIRLK